MAAPLDLDTQLSTHFQAEQALVVRQIVQKMQSDFQAALINLSKQFEYRIMKLEAEIMTLRSLATFSAAMPGGAVPIDLFKAQQSASTLPIPTSTSMPVVPIMATVTAAPLSPPSRPEAREQPASTSNNNNLKSSDDEPQAESAIENLLLMAGADDRMDDENDDEGPSQGKRVFPARAVDILKEWMKVHSDYPYPTEDEKIKLASEAQLSLIQVSNWFINARRRSNTKTSKRRKTSEGEYEPTHDRGYKPRRTVRSSVAPIDELPAQSAVTPAMLLPFLTASSPVQPTVGPAVVPSNRQPIPATTTSAPSSGSNGGGAVFSLTSLLN